MEEAEIHEYGIIMNLSTKIKVPKKYKKIQQNGEKLLIVMKGQSLD